MVGRVCDRHRRRCAQLTQARSLSVIPICAVLHAPTRDKNKNKNLQPQHHLVSPCLTCVEPLLGGQRSQGHENDLRAGLSADSERWMGKGRKGTQCPPPSPPDRARSSRQEPTSRSISLRLSLLLSSHDCSNKLHACTNSSLAYRMVAQLVSTKATVCSGLTSTAPHSPFPRCCGEEKE